MKCLDCGSENVDRTKFCNTCGARLEMPCPNCHARNPCRNKFCMECGYPLSAPPSMKPYKLSFDEKISKIRKYLPEGLTQKILTQKNRIEGEKRQVTVMFCDLAGYSFLAQKLGPEGAYILMDQIYDILIHKVREFGGTVNELTGDGVMAASNLRSCFDVSAERGLSPFVGRNREIGILMEAFDRAKQGCGQVFSIVGEAGVGKSRLLYEFRKSVANEEITFLEGKCLSYGKYAAYHPLSDLLTSSFDVHNDDDEQEVRRKVEGVTELLHLGMEIIPFLLELQGIKNSGIDKIPMSPESRKEKTTEAVRQVILKNARRRPLVIALEDLHWVDKTSEETLRCMLDAVPGARLLLIFTYRPEYEHTWGGPLLLQSGKSQSTSPPGEPSDGWPNTGGR